MKILFLETKSYNNGGTERMVSYIANGLQRNGYEVYDASLYSCKGKTRFFPLDKEIGFFDLNGFDYKKTAQYAESLKQIIIENSIDYVIAICHYNCPVAAQAVKDTPAKLILWDHFNAHYKLHKSRIRDWLFNKSFRRYCINGVDKIVVLTEQDKTDYKDYLKAKQEIAVIPNVAFSKQYQYDNNSKTIISCGWIRYVKGFDMAIEVAAKVLPNHPDWKWIVWGTEYYANYKQELDKLIKKHGLENRFLFPGMTKEMDKKYNESSFYVMTSRYEGLPMVLLEAKSHGLPLISFDIKTGPSEIIRDNVNGYLVEPANIDIMSEKVEYLINHPEKRQEFSDNSQLDMDKFDYDNILAKWCELLK